MRGASIGPAAAAALFLCISVAQPACRRQAQPVERETAEIVTPVGAVRAETAGIRAVVRGSGVVAPAEGGEFLVVPPEPARILDEAYRRLAGGGPGADRPAAEWLLDNYYIVQRAVQLVREEFPPAFERRLPRSARGEPARLPVAYALAKALAGRALERVIQGHRAAVRRHTERTCPGFLAFRGRGTGVGRAPVDDGHVGRAVSTDRPDALLDRGLETGGRDDHREVAHAKAIHTA